MTVLKSSIRPLIQVNVLPGFKQQTTPTDRATDLPEDKMEWIKKAMIPDARSKLIKNEKFNSPTRLLATTLALKLLNKFGTGTMQRRLQEIYEVRAKQLATCITGRNYLGGTDRRKRKASDGDTGPSTSKKSAGN